MNIPIPAIKEIKRVIAHTIYPKTETKDARVKTSKKILKLSIYFFIWHLNFFLNDSSF